MGMSIWGTTEQNPTANAATSNNPVWIHVENLDVVSIGRGYSKGLAPSSEGCGIVSRSLR